MAKRVNDQPIWTCTCGMTHTADQAHCWNCKQMRREEFQQLSEEDSGAGAADRPHTMKSGDARDTHTRAEILRYAEAMRQGRQPPKKRDNLGTRDEKQFGRWGAREDNRAQTSGGATVGFTVARIVAAFMLFFALDRNPYDYYVLLRWVVCGVSVYGAWIALELDKAGWFWCFGIIALVFNPLIPFHLSRETWTFIDIAGAMLLLGSILVLGRS
ncbi:MAG: DUF6804 family protein [Nitrososphaerales archaeon]